MTAFNPIGPGRAIEFCDIAQLPDAKTVIAEFAAAGLIRSYARLIETIEAGGRCIELRDATIPRDLWRRIIAERKLADVWNTATVKLDGSPNHGTPAVKVVGIRFNEIDLTNAAKAHSFPAGRGSSSSGAATAAVGVRTDAESKPLAILHSVETQGAEVSKADAPTKNAKATPSSPTPNLNSITISVEDAVAVSNLSRSTIYKLMDNRTLENTKVGRRRLINTQSLKDYLSSQPDG